MRAYHKLQAMRELMAIWTLWVCQACFCAFSHCAVARWWPEFLAAVIFHNNLSDQMEMIIFMKNFAIAGGLLLLAEHGAGAYSLDNRK